MIASDYMLPIAIAVLIVVVFYLCWVLWQRAIQIKPEDAEELERIIQRNKETKP